MSQDAQGLFRAERMRQIHSEGYTARHDHGKRRELRAAAETYYDHAARALQGRELTEFRDPDTGQLVPPATWPWGAVYWKPADEKRTLVKAGALFMAALDDAKAMHDTNEIALSSAGLAAARELLQGIIDGEEPA